MASAALLQWPGDKRAAAPPAESPTRASTGRVHYPGDVLAGLIGTTLAQLTTYMGDQLVRSRRDHRVSSPAMRGLAIVPSASPTGITPTG